MPKLTRETARAAGLRRSRGAFLAIAAGVAVLLATAAVAVPALVSGGLIVRGVADGHPSWIALGGLSGALWSGMCLGTVRGRGAKRSATPPQSAGRQPSDPARD